MLPPGNLVIRQEEELAQAAFDFATDAETHTKIANEELSERLHAVTEEQRQFLDQKLSDHTLSGLEREEIIEEHDRELSALQAQVCVSVIHTHTHTHTQPPTHTHSHTPHTHTQAHTLTHTHTQKQTHTPASSTARDGCCETAVVARAAARSTPRKEARQNGAEQRQGARARAREPSARGSSGRRRVVC